MINRMIKRISRFNELAMVEHKIFSLVLTALTSQVEVVGELAADAAEFVRAGAELVVHELDSANW
jgi:hypothetical protein